jgi:Family of unknown function (DUF5309)
MATVTNAYTTASAVGIREDLSNRIYRVDVEDTPFISAVGTSTSTNTLHEWQTRLLSAVNTANAVPEGDEVARSAATPNVRRNNVCQISRKDASVTGTLESVDKAGRDSEMAIQMADRTIELRKDMESILISNQAFSNGATRNLRGFEAWIRTNTSRFTGGVDPVDPAVTPGTTATDGTLRPFTETLVLDTMQKVYTAGGNVEMALMGPGQKRTASTFTGRAVSQVMVGKNEIRQAANLYDTDFGAIKMTPHRYVRSAGRTCLLIDPDNVKVSYLRKFVRFPLAKIGDAETRVILSEYTLEMCNERAHGVIADLL